MRMRKRLILLTLVLIFSLATYLNIDASRLTNVVERVESSVVFVEALNQWSGSGVIVSPHTVLTARHVVRDAVNLRVETIGGKIYEAIYWVVDPNNDCALIFFDPREPFQNIAKFTDSDKLQIGETIFTIGSPFGRSLFNTVTLGIISNLNRQISFFGTCGLITSDAAGNPGNSGGPVFDMQGKIIGIVVGTKWGSEGLNIIVPSNVCQELMKSPR